MGADIGCRYAAFSLVFVFLISSFAGLISNQDSSDLDLQITKSASTPIGQSSLLTVGSFPNGSNQKVSISIPDGEAIQSLDLNIEAATLTTSTAFSWDDSLDYSTGTVYDGMDVNGTSLTILPQGWIYDFEGVNPFTFTGSNTWFYGSDTTLGAGGVSSGTSAIYTYNGNYPTYMGGPYWATSPVMNCSGCSGSWNLNFEKRLGVESSYYDHAYVSVKSSTGSWVNVWSNPQSTTNDGSYVQQTISITNYIQNNPSFQVRFGLGSSDGSVQYTGWNVDDVEIEPAGGTSAGEGNWTSLPISPLSLGMGEDRAFGMMYMDAIVPPGSLFEWSLMDASTGQLIPQYSHFETTSMDFGMIDWQKYPSVRIKIHMGTGQGNSAPIINGIYFDGEIIEDFIDDPNRIGWQLQGATWSNGVISGTSDVLSPIYRMRSGFGAIASNSVMNSGCTLQYKVGSESSWVTLASDTIDSLTSPEFMVQFKFTSSGTCNIDVFDVELIHTSVADGLRIDVGLDGISDWSLNNPGNGRFGIQDEHRFGSSWKSSNSIPTAPSYFELLLPASGVNDFSFALASDVEMKTPYVTISVEGTSIINKPLSNLLRCEQIILTSSELTSLNNALGGANAFSLKVVTIRVGSSETPAEVMMGGIFAPWDADLDLSFSPTDPLILALNNELTSIVAIAGVKEIKLPVRMSSTGAVRLTVEGITSQSSVTPVSISVSNVVDTFTPSVDWYEVESVFDFSSLGVSNALSHAKSNGWMVEMKLSGQNQYSSIRCPVISLNMTGSSIAGCSLSGVNLLWTHSGADGRISVIDAGQYLQVDHQFKFPESWDDESSLSLSVFLIAPSGPMIPVNEDFGLGDSAGVENDVTLKSWSVVSSKGVHSTESSPYLNPGQEVIIEAVLGFENVWMSPSPRPGQTLVRLLEDGVEVATSSMIVNGIVSLPYLIPTGRSSVDLEIVLEPLKGQGIGYETDNNLTFEFDTVAPALISMDVEQFDHRDISPINEFNFQIADRPVLPSHAKTHLWRSWLDDANMDGLMDESEVVIKDLIIPMNLTHLQADYTLEMDNSLAPDGSYFSAWLEIADPAGNMLANSGSYQEPLFNVQLRSDGAPSLGSNVNDWGLGENVWIHPGESNIIEVSIWDSNGISDVSEINLALSGNTIDRVEIIWFGSNQTCYSSEIYLNIESCQLIPLDSSNVFSPEGLFTINFSLEWGFNPDVSQLRSPHLMLRDYQGQSNNFDLSSLDWKFSGELLIERDELALSTGGEVIEGLAEWITPRTDIGISGEIDWYRSGRNVAQPLDLMFSISDNDVEIEYVGGEFSGVLISPLEPGTYALTGTIFDPPNGAIDKGPQTPFGWFIIDEVSPKIISVKSPVHNSVINEKDWEDLTFEIIISEDEQLDAQSLILNWAIYPAGLGLNVDSVANGTRPLNILGGKSVGESIPCKAQLDLGAELSQELRAQNLELRIWVTGADKAGHEISKTFNDIDAPLSVWIIEQRIAHYSFSTPQMTPSKELHANEQVDLAVLISNDGKAAGSAQLVLELVESNGARTRLDAREITLEAGGNIAYTHQWTPDRVGTMWIEFHIVNGPSTQTASVHIDAAKSEGAFASIGEINPILLIIIILLSASLVGLIAYGLKDNNNSKRKFNPSKQNRAEKSLPSIKQFAKTKKQNEQEVTGQEQYSGLHEGSSPGENPYA